MKIDHIAIYVYDLEGARNFFGSSVKWIDLYNN